MKPARIKGTVMYDPIGRDKNSAGYRPYLVAETGAAPHLVLPIDNPDALVEQVARAMFIQIYHVMNESRFTVLHQYYANQARAALRSIGVPLKKS